MNHLNADIRSGQFSRVYLLFGNEPYLVHSFKKRLTEAARGGDEMNFLALSGREALDPDRLRDFTDTMPFFADRRVLLLEDTGLFKSASEGFESWIEGLPETAVVIFAEREADKRNRLYKLVSKTGYAAELSHPEEKQLKSWMLSIIKGYGLNITVEAGNLLLRILSGDMESGKNEIDKLCVYCTGKGAIEAGDVEAVCSVQLENRVFDLVASVTAGDEQGALKLYYDLLALKEPPLRILYLIAKEIGRLSAVKVMLRDGRSRDEIAAVLGMKSYFAGKLINSCGRYTAEELSASVEYALDLEKAVKTGNLADTVSVELLILGFSRTGKKRRV